jgi:hypothetical protein
MKQMLYLVPVLIAALPPAPVAGAVQRTTAKGMEPFAQCFTQVQDRASRPWSFIPKESGGGTFSNAGATGVSRPYFLEVADRGAKREIRLVSGTAFVQRAVDRCI